MKIVIKDGLLWRDNTINNDNIISCLEADKIANANGFMYVETLVKKYPENTVLYLDTNFKITEKG